MPEPANDPTRTTAPHGDGHATQPEVRAEPLQDSERSGSDGLDAQNLTAGAEELPPAQADFYRRLRARLQRWSERRLGGRHRLFAYVMAAPDLFHLLCKLMLDASVAVSDKAVVAAAVVYFMTPFDIIPELILGPTGFLDDVALAAYVLQRLLRSNPEAVKRHWAGDDDIAQQVESLLEGAQRTLGLGRWTTLMRYVDGRGQDDK